jgi:hypothetical protein
MEWTKAKYFSFFIHLKKKKGEAFQHTLEGKRPTIPAECPSVVKEVITRCWAQNSEDRPDFNQVLSLLNHQF